MNVVIMYVDDQTIRRKESTYRRTLLRESYREDGKVKTKTIGNISRCSDLEIEAIKIALKMKGELPALKAISEGEAENGKSVGAISTLYQVSQKIGIYKALGNSNEALLVLWMVIARFLGAKSRLAAVRYANLHSVCEVLGLKPFNENHLYSSLNWLNSNQNRIEEKLFKSQIRGKRQIGNQNIYLYDLSSSYLEGDKNELAAFGYNRDGKKGKKQICYGLLTDSAGDPISVEAFKGNTTDNKTLGSQLQKLKKRFHCKYITIVGDKGMIKKAQLEVISNKKFLNYITTITKPQIRSLVKDGVIQYELFDATLAEIDDTENEVRYILRRNPVRCSEIRENRISKLKHLREKIAQTIEYLQEHPRAKTETHLKKMKALAKRLKFSKYVIIEEKRSKKRNLELRILRKEYKEARKLDGCYVVKTDLRKEVADKQEIHDRYKDLIRVEQAFRIEKSELDMRPIFLRKEERTRAHLFVVMLAYKIQRHIRNAWKDMDMTVDEGLKQLGNITATNIRIKDQIVAKVPKPSNRCKELLEPLKVRIPTILPYIDFEVVTKSNLPDRRKFQNIQ